MKDGSAVLVEGTDYTLAYTANTNAGTATVTATGKGKRHKDGYLHHQARYADQRNAAQTSSINLRWQTARTLR